MKYAYYPGCSLHATAKSFDMSVKSLCRHLDIELWEIPDWSCCGASSAHSFDHLLGLALPAKTLVPAEEQGLDVLAPCAACWQRLIRSNLEIKHNPEMRQKINTAIGADLKGTVNVVSIIEAIYRVGLGKIEAMVKKPLKGLKVASYYGCYYVKPPKVAHVDDPENPHLIDDMMAALGAEIVDWPFRTECCGASLVFVDKDTTFQLTKKILDMAEKCGADLVVTACPICQMNLDMRQSQINKKYGSNLNLPVMYFTQLMAYVMGSSAGEIGLYKNYVPAQTVLNKLG